MKNTRPRISPAALASADLKTGSDRSLNDFCLEIAWRINCWPRQSPTRRLISGSSINHAYAKVSILSFPVLWKTAPKVNVIDSWFCLKLFFHRFILQRLLSIHDIATSNTVSHRTILSSSCSWKAGGFYQLTSHTALWSVHNCTYLSSHPPASTRPDPGWLSLPKLKSCRARKYPQAFAEDSCTQSFSVLLSCISGQLAHPPTHRH